MTKKEKRVAIAEDVLLQLRYLVVNGHSGYVTLPKEFAKYDAKDFKDVLTIKARKQCGVCAIGACLVSKAILFDKVGAPQVCLYGDYVKFEGAEVVRNLKSIFSEKQLAMIESAFEISDYPSASQLNYNIIIKCKNFGKKYGNPKRRLRAIMQNIIANDGKFVP